MPPRIFKKLFQLKKKKMGANVRQNKCQLPVELKDSNEVFILELKNLSIPPHQAVVIFYQFPPPPSLMELKPTAPD